MAFATYPIKPFADQKPGTSGLRKKVRVFEQPGYAEAFIQSIFDAVPRPPSATLVIGGDGRYHNDRAIQQAIRIAAANGFGRVIVGRNGILSTPAVSHLIREYGASGGLIFSASHNPAGREGDFGIKYNVANGGPAPEAVTDAIYRRTLTIDRWLAEGEGALDLGAVGELQIGAMRVEIVDPVTAYADLMEQQFDFAAIRKAAAQGWTMAFDAMHAVTGPYAIELFENRLGFAPGTVRNREPLADFGGGHPDPNLVHAYDLYSLMMSAAAPEFGAASDGDGDRNLIIGRGCYVTPSDSLAILAANARLVPAFRDGLKGIARSMPTSRAADQVATELDLPCFETPTGWKFFGTLLDAGMATICGEESAGTGADHIREKDGLWAILFWLNILSVRNLSVDQLVSDHWQRFGRHYYARHDYEDVPAAAADAVIEMLISSLPGLAGRRFGELEVTHADNFSYRDPVDGSLSSNQGVRVLFGDTARIVIRLSGTGTGGATLRIYLERYIPPSGCLDAAPEDMLRPLVAITEQLAGVARLTGRSGPDVVT
jgi:phosphoglucomutase